MREYPWSYYFSVLFSDGSGPLSESDLAYVLRRAVGDDIDEDDLLELLSKIDPQDLSDLASGGGQQQPPAKFVELTKEQRRFAVNPGYKSFYDPRFEDIDENADFKAADFIAEGKKTRDFLNIFKWMLTFFRNEVFPPLKKARLLKPHHHF